ncbi:MAG: toxin-antitoxin system PIN domain toxin [Verrucomicrobiales bacterium]|jgi:toxin-antitoxin system PIN domain toxin
MIVPDANLLIYAYDSTSPHHRASIAWWEGVLSGVEPVGIPWVVVLAFTRILTHPRVVNEPLEPREVRERVDQWLTLDHVRLLNPGPNSVSLFFDFLEEAGIGGNLSTDALIAVIAKEYGAVVHSNDRDFDRFSGLKWINPLEAKS